MTATDLERACAAAPMQGQCGRIGGQRLLDDAMRYVLSGEAAAAARARSALLAGFACGEGVEQTPAGGYALAYDWVWPTLTPDERRQIEATLADCAANIARSLRGNGPHLWHGFSSQAAALALVALAIDDHPARDSLRADAVELFRRQALAAYAVTGGAWPEGFSYLRTHFFSGDPPYQYVLDALRAWDSAVEEDHPKHASIFATIAAEEGDWLRGLAYHVVYGTLGGAGEGGKPTLLRTGDMPTGQAYPNRQYRPFVDAIARIYGDPSLRRWGEELEAYWPFVGGDGTYHPIHRYSLPYNLPVDVPLVPAGSLPRVRIWSRDDLGEVITRSSWGSDEVVISYRAGKWFTGHQHMDQGNVGIWYRGPLVVDAGVYASWGTEHREAYYLRTVAHNSLLIHRHGETFAQHPAFRLPVNDDGQRIHTYNRRGCAQCMQSVEEWRANVGAGLHFEAGRIDAFADGNWETVIASDLTAAYNSTLYSTPGNEPKVDAVQRDLLYVRPGLLVLLDRVRVLAGSEPPRFTLHFPVRPELSGSLPVVAGTADDGILAGSASGFGFRVTNTSGGCLLGRTILPTDVQVSLIGGPNYRYWVDGANRVGGAEGLEGPPAEPAAWRLEVAPAATPQAIGPTDVLLVHALTIGDAGAPAIAVRPLPVVVDPAVAGAVLALWAPEAVPSAVATNVLLVASGSVARERVSFVQIPSIPDGLAHLFLVGATPGASYRLGLHGYPVMDAAASAEGIVEFLVRGSEDIVVAACPPPPGARAPWRDLCAASPSQPGATPTGPSATPTGERATPTVTGTRGVPSPAPPVATATPTLVGAPTLAAVTFVHLPFASGP